MLIAHGVSSRGDLPLPGWMFAWGAALALFVSFVALGALWKRPLLVALAEGRTLRIGSRVRVGLLMVGRGVMLGLLLLCIVAGIFGTDDDGSNIAPVAFYAVAWVGAQVVSGITGNWWHAVNPVVTVARLAEWCRARVRGPRPNTAAAPPGWLGMWPAAFGMLGFLFLELAHPSGSSPRVIGWALVIHTLVSVVLALRWGVAWLSAHEPFGALLDMIGRLAPVSYRRDGVTVRAPLSGLAVMPVASGTAATLLIVLGGTTFDGFASSQMGRSLIGRPRGWTGSVVLFAGMLASIAVVTMLFAAGTAWIARSTQTPWRRVTTDFVPTLVPIVFGYAIAHYAQFLIDESQTFVFRLSDPGGQGWDLFGGAGARPDLTLVSPAMIAWIQVLAILGGHLGGIVMAHDRSIDRYRGASAFTSQAAMLVMMVIYSTLGLWLLLNA